MTNSGYISTTQSAVLSGPATVVTISVVNVTAVLRTCNMYLRKVDSEYNAIYQQIPTDFELDDGEMFIMSVPFDLGPADTLELVCDLNDSLVYTVVYV